MRSTTLLKKLLGLKHLVVEGFGTENDALVIHVRPSWRRPTDTDSGKHPLERTAGAVK